VTTLRGMAIETTLVLVKPDGVRRGLAGEVVSRFERRGYDLRGARLLKLTRALAQQHYAEHKGKPFFGELVSFITSGPVLALAVRGEDAIAGIRTMMGATNPANAAPGTIRGDLATELAENIVHGSDSRVSAKRELALFFPDGLV
jgi:nucleoside-diphosphate kinase